MNHLNLVRMVCQCNVDVIPESIKSMNLGYKGYEFLTIANFVDLFLLPYLRDFNFLSLFFRVCSAVEWLRTRSLGGQCKGHCTSGG